MFNSINIDHSMGRQTLPFSESCLWPWV